MLYVTELENHIEFLEKNVFELQKKLADSGDREAIAQGQLANITNEIYTSRKAVALRHYEEKLVEIDLLKKFIYKLGHSPEEAAKGDSE